MAAHIDEEALQSSLQRLREAAFDADVAGVMRRTVDAAHGVFGYGGAGIMFITESGDLSYVAASDEAGRQLEEAQASAGQGPCYESYVYAREVVSRDVHADSRWPELRTRLSAQVRAVAGTPVLLSGSPVGTLNVYRDEPAEWDKSDVNALTAYSALIAASWPASCSTPWTTGWSSSVLSVISWVPSAWMRSPPLTCCADGHATRAGGSPT
jgi:GAF domain-containing protein